MTIFFIARFSYRTYYNYITEVKIEAFHPDRIYYSDMEKEMDAYIEARDILLEEKAFEETRRWEFNRKRSAVILHHTLDIEELMKKEPTEKNIMYIGMMRNVIHTLKSKMYR